MKILDKDGQPQETTQAPEENEAPGMQPTKVRAYTIMFADFENGLSDIGSSNPDNINAFELLGAFDYIATMIKAGLTREPKGNVYEQLQKSLGLTQIDEKNNYRDLDGNFYKLTKLGFKQTSASKE